MKVTVMDFETTGMEPETNSVVEVAGVDLDTSEWHQSLVMPQHPISYGAMATHLITPGMVEDAPLLDDAMRDRLYSDCDVMAFHNAEFDKAFLPETHQESIFNGDVKVICTYRCALHLLPEAESHKNIALCLEAGLDIWDAPGDENASMPHRAIFDAWATHRLLEFLVDTAYDKLQLITQDMSLDPTREDCIAHLVELTQKPLLLRKVNFGKHSGQEWSKVPLDYLHWVRGQDFDEDVQYTAQYWIEQRRL